MNINTTQTPQASVSVIVPVYNGERYIIEALDSISRQTHQPAEVIVVDDGSTDKTADLVESYGSNVTCLRQANSGAATARNAGIQASHSEYLAFLDHDDLWVANKLEMQLAAFTRNPELDMVFGHATQFYCASLDETERSKLRLPDKPMPAYIAGSRLVKRDSFLKAGLYDPSIRMGECLDWHARAIDAGLKMCMLTEVVYLRRIHATNMGRTAAENRSEYARVMKRLLDRRRQQKRT